MSTSTPGDQARIKNLDIEADGGLIFSPDVFTLTNDFGVKALDLYSLE
jgi:hypothetical protein